LDMNKKWQKRSHPGQAKKLGDSPDINASHTLFLNIKHIFIDF